MSDTEYLLQVDDLHTSFNVPSGEVRSVNGVSFNLKKGEVLGIVGESGSGKSVTAYSIMQILEKPGRVIGGSIKFNGQELLGLPRKQLQKIRGEKISIIFQDSMSSLNPVWSIGNQLKEVVKIHSGAPIVKEYKEKVEKLEAKIKAREGDMLALRKELKAAKKELNSFAESRALEMLKLVGINEPEKRLKQYPFEFSGGMLQRIMIAMALICEPELIIADEPTTALDVTIQAQILELLLSIQKKMGMGIIIITHDLGVVAQVCDKVNVMYAGRIVERGTVDDIFYNPKHEYTKGLINSIPKMDKKVDRLEPIPGNPVDVFRLPSGCSFAPRCQNCMKVCLKKYPKFIQVDEHHDTACFKYLEELRNENKISDEEFDKYVASCQEGNKAFARISRVDVDAALEAFEKAKADLKNAGNDISNEEKEVLKYHVYEAKQEYYRARRDFKYALKDRKESGSERFSIDKNDVRKKISHHKVSIKSNAANMSEEEFETYLNELVIATTPVNASINAEEVEARKVALKDAKKAFKQTKFNTRREKVVALDNIDKLQESIRTGKNDLVWLNYVNKKLESTKSSLRNIYIKAKLKNGGEN